MTRHGRLTPLQDAVLEAFFATEHEFFLSGGAALAGFHLGQLRDLVDVLELERRGLRAEEFLEEAHAKDGGCTPATLSFLLSEWRIPENAKLPAGYTSDEIRAFKDSLAERLITIAHPR